MCAYVLKRVCVCPRECTVGRVRVHVSVCVCVCMCLRVYVVVFVRERTYVFMCVFIEITLHICYKDLIISSRLEIILFVVIVAQVV